MKTIWNRETGESAEYESVDAREILTKSPDLYTDIDPNAPKDGKMQEGVATAADPDGDGRPGSPQNVASVENEFRREPVGSNPPAVNREGTIIRNPVTDTPAMAPPAGQDGDDKQKKEIIEVNKSMHREELDKVAKGLGLNPDEYSNKDELIEAIEDVQTK